jgi:hypothetical protein
VFVGCLGQQEVQAAAGFVNTPKLIQKLAVLHQALFSGRGRGWLSGGATTHGQNYQGEDVQKPLHVCIAERGGERWRRTPSARIGKQVPPAAIRSTEKLASVITGLIVWLLFMFLKNSVDRSLRIVSQFSVALVLLDLFERWRSCLAQRAESIHRSISSFVRIGIAVMQNAPIAGELSQPPTSGIVTRSKFPEQIGQSIGAYVPQRQVCPCAVLRLVRHACPVTNLEPIAQ